LYSVPTYLHSGPPVLLNPERVIPYSESQRYERHFTPNVSLAPTPQTKSKSDEEDELGEVQEQPQELTVHVRVKAKEVPKAAVVQTHVNVPSLPTAMESSSREYREYDLPTDTDDSSVGQSSPLDSREEPRFSDSPVFESTLEQELAMIHRALDGKVPHTKEGRDGFLHQYSKLRARQEELVHCLCRDKNMLKREVNLVQNQNDDLACKLRALENEVTGLRLDGEQRERAVQEERVALAQRMAAIENENKKEIYDKSPRQCEMKARLQHFESLYHDLQYENSALRSELQRKGVDIVQLLANKKQSMVDANANNKNAAGTQSAGQRSNGSEKLKIAVGGGGGDGGLPPSLLLPQAHSRIPKTLPPKKERDLIVE
ncbi:ski oncogene-like, partial [Littorina saxatilis]|uniref:ski oncogene-like n=1 Tax=Littorina saxatilis TaxID=31220 RepID=UPI0038B4F489